MKKILIALALLATTAPAAMAEGHKYSFDKEHTAFSFP
jgi:polyisoprenoid-binding protein YceI